MAIALGHAVGLFHVVGGKEDGDALLFVELLHVGPELVAGLRVEAEGGLIEEDDFRGVEEAARRFRRRRRIPPENCFTGSLRRSQSSKRRRSISERSPRSLRGTEVEAGAVEVHVFPGGEFIVNAGILEDDAEGVCGLRSGELRGRGRRW